MGYTKSKIRGDFSERFAEYNRNNRILDFFRAELHKNYGEIKEIAEAIDALMEDLYSVIPEKERLGKGSVFIAKSVAPDFLGLILNSLKNLDKDLRDKHFLDKAEQIIFAGMEEDLKHIKNIIPSLIAEYCVKFPESIPLIFKKLSEWGDLGDWEFREMCTYPVIKALRADRNLTLSLLKDMAKSDNANIRRLVAESLRPRTDNKWLRDPGQNAEVLQILSLLKNDPSEYVRKSVGNNLKDLSKYMPEKVLSFVESWIKDAAIKVSDDLASKSKKDLGESDYRLIWTVKHALRWLKARNPEFHERIRGILGENYVKYYDEKKNKMALPK